MGEDKGYRIQDKITVAIFTVCVFLLSLVELYSYDIWFHLSYGREVLRLGYIPKKEIFLFSVPDSYMINPEWLFDILVYLIWIASGSAGIVLMKAILITAIFFMLLLDGNIEQKRVHSSVLVLFLSALIMRFRFIERPELFAYLFLSINLYCIHLLLHRGYKKQLLVVPLLQLIWANMHASSVMMPLIVGFYLAGGLLIGWINEKTGLTLPGGVDKGGAKWLSALFVLVLVATFINPFSYHIFLQPYELSTKSIYKHAITELQPLDIFNTKSLLFWFVLIWCGSSFLNWKRVNPLDFILSSAFLYMASQAQRFLPLFLVVSSPIVIRNISYLYGMTPVSGFEFRIWRFATYALPMILLLVISVLVIKGDDEVRFGFGIYPYRYPEGAIEYLKRNGLKINLFNTFHFGGYIEWRYFPDGRPIVDGRGPMHERLLEKVLLGEEHRMVFTSLEGMYGFEAAIIENPVIKKNLGRTDISYLQIVEKESFAPQDWALVYWDDACLLYVKRTDKFKDLIEKDEYRFATPLMWHAVGKQMWTEGSVDNYIKELERNIKSDPDAISARIYLAMLILQKGGAEEARRRLQEIERNVSEQYTRNRFGGLYYSLLGRCYLKEGDIRKAITYYEKASRLSPDPAIRVSLGELYLKAGMEKKGEKILKEVIESARRNTYAIEVLKKYYSDTGQKEKIRMLDEKYKEAIKLALGEEHFIKATKFYIARHYDEAIKEYVESLKVNPSSAPAWTNLGYVFYDKGDFEQARGCFIKALEVDPNWPEAHYGMGLIYEKMNERDEAIEHFRNYLKINPRGFWSKRAEEKIARLKK